MFVLQANAVIRALGNENIIRESYSSGVDVLLSLRDLQLGAIGDLKVIIPGRRRQFILGEQETSLYCYKAVLLDAKKQRETFVYHCGVFIVPKVCFMLSICIVDFSVLTVVSLNLLPIVSLIYSVLQEMNLISGCIISNEMSLKIWRK
jgi:hypothetical protein